METQRQTPLKIVEPRSSSQSSTVAGLNVIKNMSSEEIATLEAEVAAASTRGFAAGQAAERRTTVLAVLGTVAIMATLFAGFSLPAFALGFLCATGVALHVLGTE